jgi:hypothetical protein
MTERCLGPGEIAAARDAGPDDPRRRHLDGCPWCQALAASRDLFDETEDLPAGADPEGADARLAAFLDRDIAGRPSDGAGASAEPPAGPRPRHGWRRHALPVSLAAAAVLAVVVGIQVARDLAAPPARSINLRAAPGGESAPVLATPRPVADGGLVLSWSAGPADARYAVEVVTGRRTVALRLDAGAGTSLALSADRLARLRAEPPPLFAVVVASVGGDEVARSLPRLLPTGRDR